MNPENEDLEITNLYRAYLDRKLDREQLAVEKRAFIEAHFDEPVTVSFFQTLPALALTAFCAFLIVSLRPPVAVVPVHEPAAYPAPVVWGETAAPDHSAAGLAAVLAAEPAVQVRRVTSTEGPVLVYQKPYKNAPITIIWVFPGG